MTGPLYALGRLCVRYRFVVLPLWLAVVIALAVVGRGVGQQLTDKLVLPGTDSQKASDTLTKRFPDQANGTNPLALQAPKGHKLNEGKYKQAIDGVVGTYKKDKRIIKVVSPVASSGAGQLTKGKSIGYISLTLK